MTVAAASSDWTTVTARAAHNSVTGIDMADSHKDGDEGHGSLGNLEVDWVDSAARPLLVTLTTSAARGGGRVSVLERMGEPVLSVISRSSDSQ